MIEVNSVGTQEMFQGAYNMRMMQNRMQEAAQAAAAAPVKTVQDVLGPASGDNVKIEMSKESRAFLDAAPERKAAMRAAAEKTEAPPSADPFAGTGDLKKQYLVFSEQLYNAGFYDDMSDDQVRQAEGLLRDITSGMDAISPNSLSVTLPDAVSKAGAQLELASSVEALNAFADKYLEGDTKEEFQSLVAAYEEHNAPIADHHVNIQDRRDVSLALLPPATTLSSLQGSYGEPESAEAVASRKLGALQQTLVQSRRFRADVADVFQSIRSGDLTVTSALAHLQHTFMNFATGDSLDARVRSVVAARNENVFAHINAYWDTLMNL